MDAVDYLQRVHFLKGLHSDVLHLDFTIKFPPHPCSQKYIAAASKRAAVTHYHPHTNLTLL